MTDLIAEEKTRIRKQCRQIRMALEKPFREQASRKIGRLIADWPIFQDSQVILSYMSIKAEVDLRPLMEDYPQKTWVLPRILANTQGGMVLHVYDPERLVRHAFGMDEPDESLPIAAPENIQLALIPGLAYDRRGWRLGYGGGYYDRFLKGFAGVSLGIVYEALFLENLPHGEHDVPMKWIGTEIGLYKQGASLPGSNPG
jgi:5-formyltetrahydrofolate cyclo-ligase